MQGEEISNRLEQTVCIATDICRSNTRWLDLRVSTLQRILWDLQILQVDGGSTRADVKYAAMHMPIMQQPTGTLFLQTLRILQELTLDRVWFA
jgi:hypothetical protein